MLRNRKQNGSGPSSPRYPGSPTSASSTPTGSPRIIVTRSLGSPRHEVGEIDTRSPFQSVRAAVCLFGDTSSSLKANKLTIKKSTTPEEMVKEKESQLNLALRELDSFKQQIRSTETTKDHALRELEIAKTTLQELTAKLGTLCKSKQAANEETEAAKARATQLEEEKKEDSDHLVVNENLQEKLEETNKVIQAMQEQLNTIRASDLDAFTRASSELDLTKKALLEIDAEKASSKSLVDFLQVELESLKGHNRQLKRKVVEAEAVAENFRVDLDDSKKEFNADSRIQQFTSEAAHFLQEAEEMKRKAELLREEAETARVAAKEAEEKLKVALKEAEDAKEDTSAVTCSLEVEKYKALSQKVEEIRNETDIKVANAMAQVETISANEKEVLKKVEARLKEKQDIVDATKGALKEIATAEEAKKAIDRQLQKKTSRRRSWSFFKWKRGHFF